LGGLIGVFDYAMLKDGIPDEAYKPLTGDDKDAARGWAKLNRGQRDSKAKERYARRDSPTCGPGRCRTRYRRHARGHAGADHRKEKALARLHAGSWLHLKAACDLYVAAFDRLTGHGRATSAG
jgi:hypothetical protein